MSGRFQRAEGSDPAAVNTVFAYTRKLGKTPILVKDTPGFLVNRLLMFYSTEGLWLLDEGFKIEDLDRVLPPESTTDEAFEEELDEADEA